MSKINNLPVGQPDRSGNYALECIISRGEGLFFCERLCNFVELALRYRKRTMRDVGKSS
jgi:hypothetical protein